MHPGLWPAFCIRLSDATVQGLQAQQRSLCSFSRCWDHREGEQRKVRAGVSVARRLSNEGSRLLQGWRDLHVAKGNPFLLLVWMNLGPEGARTHLYLGNMQLSQVEEDKEPELLSYSYNKRQIPQADTMERTMKHTLHSPGLYGPGKGRSTDSLSFLHLTQSSWGGFIYWRFEAAMLTGSPGNLWLRREGGSKHI